MKTLVADNCVLEPLTKAHAKEMFKVLSDPAIYEFENAPPQSEEWLSARYEKLETRQSLDGKQQWLNWVVQLNTKELAGYVQATILDNGLGYVAYELSSKNWRKGFGREAVSTMLSELASSYRVDTAVAVLKAMNYRSHGLLLNLGFTQASEELVGLANPESDEVVMVKTLAGTHNAA
jgi:ribosomal-protein-alanine N-acetyltransferase